MLFLFNYLQIGFLFLKNLPPIKRVTFVWLQGFYYGLPYA